MNVAPSSSNPLHSGMTPARFIGMHVFGAVFPVTAGLLVYGWRALGVLLLVSCSAMVSAAVWRRIGRRGGRVGYDHIMWLSVLLGLTLPGHLFSTTDPTGTSRYAAWPILVAAGISLSMFVWILGGAGSGRIHPVVIVNLMLFVFFADMLAPQYALKREQMFWGDLLDAEARRSVVEPGADASKHAWINAEPSGGVGTSVRSLLPPALRLESFTGGYEAPERAWISLDSLVRDRLPPLEDLIVGGQPAPIGQGSAIAAIIGGLFLLYRGLIDHRVPLLIVLTAFVAFLILPVPVVITEKERVWRWFVSHVSGVGAPLGVTFANYEMMASPLIFTAFFLATSSAIRPMQRRARVIYAFLVGLATAAFQLYVSVTIGPYLALLGVSLLTPWLDRSFRSRPLL